MTYREMMDERNDEIMCDVRERQAQVAATLERFGDDMEGFHRHVESEMAKFGYCFEPTGHGTTRLVKIEQPAGDPVQNRE